jgi:predicted Zn-dependent protease
MGEHDQRALELARQAHTLQPEQPGISDTLGWILVTQEQVEAGLEYISKAAEAQPDDPQIGYHFAYALTKAGDRASAIRQLNKLKKLELTAELQQNIAALYEQLN